MTMSKEYYNKIAHKQHWARKIMGRNFIGTEIATLMLGRKLSPYEKGVLCDMPFSVETLRACKKTHILVAIPHISAAELALGYPAAFATIKNFDWKDEGFAKTKLQVGWYLVRKEHGPNTIGRSFQANKELEKDGELGGPDEVIAPAGVVIYTMLAFSLLWGDLLNMKVRLNTTTAAMTSKDRITVGRTGFPDYKIEIACVPMCFNLRGLGAATMKKVY